MRQNTVSNEPKPCSATTEGEPCDRPAGKSGLCDGHKQRIKNGTDMDKPWRVRTQQGECKATIAGEPCGRAARSRGFCTAHLYRMKKNKPMDAPWRQDLPKVCKGTVLGIPCSRSVLANGYCEGHYYRNGRGQDMDAQWRDQSKNEGPCKGTVQGEPCDRKATRRGWCEAHYIRWYAGSNDMDAAWSVENQGNLCKSTIESEPCDREAQRLGWCRDHYDRNRRDQDMDEPWHYDPDRGCKGTIEGVACPHPHRRNGYCRRHDDRMKSGYDMDAAFRAWDSSRTCTIPGCNRQYKMNGLCTSHASSDRDYRKKAAQVEPNGFSAERLAARLLMFGRVCWMCGGDIPNVPGAFHLEHVKPLSKGGAHTPANLRPACRSCNSAKRAEWPVDTSTAHLRLDPARLP